MSNLFSEPVDPFATNPVQEAIDTITNSRLDTPPDREIAIARIELKGFRNPTILDYELKGNIVSLTIEQDSLDE